MLYCLGCRIPNNICFLVIDDTNVASLNFGAKVYNSNNKREPYNLLIIDIDVGSSINRPCTSHPIEENSKGILIQLGEKYVINHV